MRYYLAAFQNLAILSTITNDALQATLEELIPLLPADLLPGIIPNILTVPALSPKWQFFSDVYYSPAMMLNTDFELLYDVALDANSRALCNVSAAKPSCPMASTHAQAVDYAQVEITFDVDQATVHVVPVAERHPLDQRLLRGLHQVAGEHPGGALRLGALLLLSHLVEFRSTYSVPSWEHY